MTYSKMMMHPRLLMLTILFSILISCESDPGGGGDVSSDPKPTLKILSLTNASESGFQINWSIENPVGFQSIAVRVASNEDMTSSIAYVLMDDISTDHLLVENLQGATPYYYTVALLNNSTTVVESEIKSAETAYMVESIDLLTEDDYTLSGKLAYLESLPGQRPGIILMHEFGVWVNPWIGSALLRDLVADGYLCLTFFFRGHGTSTPVDDLMDLADNRGLLVRDLQSALDFMLTHELSSEELGLIGGSMGAIMALAGNGYEEVQTSVALSPTRDGVFLIFPDMTLNSVYYLAGELDNNPDFNMDFPAEASMLFELTEEPKKLDIIPGTADHGSNLLSRDSLRTSVQEWFKEMLPLQ
jgi:dienelactone hydrolase